MNTHWFLLWFLSFVQNSIHYHNFYSFSFFILFLSFFIHSIHSLDSFTFSLFLFYSYTLSIHQSIHQSILSLSHSLTRFQKYARFGRSLFSQWGGQPLWAFRADGGFSERESILSAGNGRGDCIAAFSEWAATYSDCTASWKAAHPADPLLLRKTDIRTDCRNGGVYDYAGQAVYWRGIKKSEKILCLIISKYYCSAEDL